MSVLWGAETQKAIENFPVSGQLMPLPLVHWLARLKSAAALVNAELGLLDSAVAERIARSADEVAGGAHDSQFPLDVFQTGSGTSTNMNVNEVVAALAGPDVHPNDHVNLGQSSNDTVPTALHLAAIEACERGLLPAMDELEQLVLVRAEEFSELVKAGRTHLMDAVPVTLGQEFGGYAAQVGLGADRVRSTLGRVAAVPLGGTAVGTGLNTHSDFAARVRERIAAETGIEPLAPRDRFEAQSCRDSLVELSGALKVVAVGLAKIADDLAWAASGPRTGLGELTLPELQKGSSIMPGKVNPVICEVVAQVCAQVIGNDVALSIGAGQGAFQLNARVPLMARNLLESLTLLNSSSRLLGERVIAGLSPRAEQLGAHAEASLAAATALNPVLGYDATTELVREAERSGRTLAEVGRAAGIDVELLDSALDPLRLARGG